VVEAHDGSDHDSSSVEGVLRADSWARERATAIVEKGNR